MLLNGIFLEHYHRIQGKAAFNELISHQSLIQVILDLLSSQKTMYYLPSFYLVRKFNGKINLLSTQLLEYCESLSENGNCICAS